MGRDFVWLRVSLFVEKSNWAYILHQGIKRFFDEASNKKLIEVLAIEFNYLGGENIRFAIKVPAHLAEQMAHKTDFFFTELFLTANLYKREIKLPVDGVFLPFPANTIQYGLYNIMISDYLFIDNLISIISICIIDGLEEEVVTEDVLLTLAFYLHCALISQLIELTRIDFLALYNLKSYDNADYKALENYFGHKYNENKDCLFEVEDSIRNANSDSPQWLNQWIINCREMIVPQSLATPGLLINVINDINKQLGLTDNMIMLINYFIINIYADTLRL